MRILLLTFTFILLSLASYGQTGEEIPSWGCHQLPEGFVFYRIAKGWTTLPAGSTPWDSSMPAFEDFLTAEEVWQVTLFIYEATGNEPRKM